MDIKTFFEQSAGKWFVQRTTCHVDRQAIANSKADMSVELLSADDAEVTNLCQAAGVDAKTVMTGIKVSWDNAPDWGSQSKQQGSNLLVVVEGNANSGQLLSKGKGATPLQGEYTLAADEALWLRSQQNNDFWEERIWFVSENLRMRSVMSEVGGKQRAAFYSEIRRVSS